MPLRVSRTVGLDSVCHSFTQHVNKPTTVGPAGRASPLAPIGSPSDPQTPAPTGRAHIATTSLPCITWMDVVTLFSLVRPIATTSNQHCGNQKTKTTHWLLVCTEESTWCKRCLRWWMSDELPSLSLNSLLKRSVFTWPAIQWELQPIVKEP